MSGLLAERELVAPAHLWVPPRVASAGEDAIDLAESAGLVLDAEQRLAVEAILSEAIAGERWAALEAALIEARQNGKTVALQAIVLADLFLFGARLVVWTAHRFKTAIEAFRDLKELIDGAPHLRSRVKKITESNGEEGIELVSGARVNFLARSKSSGRGMSGDRVILDEAFALLQEQMGALIPTLSARPNPQIVYASSAGLADSMMLRAIRDRGRKGGDPSLVYVEWCSPGSWDAPGCEREKCDHVLDRPGCALDDVDRWRAANPALGRRISVSYVAAERRALPVSEFGRERLGWWDEADSGGVLSAAAWAACADPDAPKPTGGCVFSFDVAPDQSSAAISVAAVRDDGLPQVEVIDYRPGTRWLPDRVAELEASYQPAGWAIDAAGAATAFLEKLADRGLQVITAQDAERGARGVRLMVAREMGQACGALQEQVTNAGMRHVGDEVLDQALANAAKVDIGDGLWRWSRRRALGDICALVAATAALWRLSQVRDQSYDVLDSVW